MEHHASVGTTRKEILGKLILDSLERYPPSLGETIRIVAIPHYFNIDILGILISSQVNDIQELYLQLQELPIIEIYGNTEGNYSVIDDARSIILEQWTTQPDKFIEYNRLLSNYFKEKIGTDRYWSSIERIEEIYHTILADEYYGVILLEREFLRSLELNQFDRCSYIQRSIDEIKSRLKVENQLWLEFYEGILAEKLQHPSEAEEKYKYLITQEAWPPELRAFLVARLLEITNKIKEITSANIRDVKEIDYKSIPESEIDIENEIQNLDDIFRQTQNEAKITFVLAIAAGGIGFLVIISGIIAAFFGNVQMGLVASAAGIVSEVTASLLLVQNNQARKRLDKNQEDSTTMRNLSRAMHIVNTASISSTEREKQTKAILDVLVAKKNQ